MCSVVDTTLDRHKDIQELLAAGVIGNLPASVPCFRLADETFIPSISSVPPEQGTEILNMSPIGGALDGQISPPLSSRDPLATASSSTEPDVPEEQLIRVSSTRDGKHLRISITIIFVHFRDIKTV